MPWVLVAAGATLLLVYVVAVPKGIAYLYRHFIGSPLERLAARRR
jgi:hypothetical protein